MVKITKGQGIGLAAGVGLIVTGVILSLRKKKSSIPETDIVLSNLSISPKSILPGGTVNISVAAKNKGNITYSAAIILLVNDTEYSEIVTLNAGENKTVSFSIPGPDEIGVAHVAIGSLKGVFLVENPSPETASLWGIVTDAATGLPVASATVAVATWGTTADNDGNYLLSGIALVGTQTFPRDFEVKVVAAGYNILRKTVRIAEGENNLDLSITPLPPPPPAKLVFTASGLPNGATLWSGWLRDVATGVEQTWGVRRIEQRVELNQPSGKFLFEYATNYGDALFGPYLIELPATSGEYVWGGSSFNAGTSTSLPATNNKQRIKGSLAGTDMGNGIAWINVSESLDVPGYENIGKYFIGKSIQIYVPIPIFYGRQFDVGLSGYVECVCSLKNKIFPIPDGSIIIPSWVGDYIRNGRTYPDEDYVFYGSVAALPGGNLSITVSGAKTPFKIAVVGFGGWLHWETGESAQLMSAKYLQGPVSGAIVTPTFPDLPFGVQYVKVYAHPDLAAGFNEGYPIDNWQLIG